MNNCKSSVETALQIISCFTAQDIDLSFDELMMRVDNTKEVVSGLLEILCSEGFLSKNKATERYRLGSKMLETAGIYIAGNNGYHHIWQILDSIKEISNETICLYRRDGDIRRCVMRIESNSPLRHTVTIGQTMPLDKGAAGKIMLAQTDENLSDIKEAGYASSFGEREAYFAALAAPVFDETGELFGALSISGPIERIREKDKSEIISELKKHAKSLSSLVNHL
ncbi:MAG: hypothetical protein C0603_04615 [Denitrovibrio sp.]|nr:MAG: hypothetical protein C0603_04615 [Denitrovibrio sp.]